VANDSLVVGPNRELANAIVYLRTKTDIHPDFASAATSNVPLDNMGCRFVPHVVVMRYTQTLAVSNSDGAVHNTKIDSTNNAQNTNVQPGTVVPFTMNVPEPSPVPVSCSVHPWMRSYVLIKDHPYAAVTDKDGRFTIPNLPAGIELEFQVWHESTPSGLNGRANVNVSGGRFKITIPKDGKTPFDMTASL
jgi:hypothetical protein